jgi:hypothetical protein
MTHIKVVGIYYLYVMISCCVSEGLTLRKGACHVKINSDSNQEKENVCITENGRTK